MALLREGGALIRRYKISLPRDPVGGNALAGWFPEEGKFLVANNPGRRSNKWRATTSYRVQILAARDVTTLMLR